MINKFSRQLLAAGLTLSITVVAVAQDKNLVPPAEGETVKAVLQDIQSKVNNIQTLKADVEFDRADKDAEKKRKKKETQKNQGEKVSDANNPTWPEPEGRDVERGPLEISRGAGAYVYLERKKEKEEFIANTRSLWKHDIDDKEARHIPTSWPVVDTFVSNALVMNVFVAMDDKTIKFRGTESVKGVPCWVLEGKSPSKLSMVGVKPTAMKMWIGKHDGIPRLIRVPQEEDTKIWLSNVQLNVPVDPSRFSFTPPADVKTKNIFGF